MQIDVDAEKADSFDSSGMSEEMAAVLLKEDYTRIAEDEKMDFSLEGFYPEQESDQIFSFSRKGNHVQSSRNGVSKESSPVSRSCLTSQEQPECKDALSKPMVLRDRDEEDHSLDGESDEKRSKGHFVPGYESGQSLMFATQGYYVFVRLLHMMYERIMRVRELAEQKVLEDLEHRNTKEGARDVRTRTDELFSLLLGALIAILKGSIDNNKFEDIVRNLIGSQAFLFFTYDKLVQQVNSYINK